MERLRSNIILQLTLRYLVNFFQSLFSLMKKVTNPDSYRDKKIRFPARPTRLARIFVSALVLPNYLWSIVRRNRFFILNVIPVSDSGEAEASIVFERLRFSLIRGFAQEFFSIFYSPLPIRTNRSRLRKNHLQESRGFWILFAGTKSIWKKLNLEDSR